MLTIMMSVLLVLTWSLNHSRYFVCHFLAPRRKLLAGRPSIANLLHSPHLGRAATVGGASPDRAAGHPASGCHGNARPTRAPIGRRGLARARGADVSRAPYKCGGRANRARNFIRSFQFIIYRTYKRRSDGALAMEGTASSLHHQQQQQQQQQQLQHAKRLGVHHPHHHPSSSTDTPSAATSGKSCDKSNQASQFSLIRSFTSGGGDVGGAPAKPTDRPRRDAPRRPTGDIFDYQ